ncbi:substrate-binding domain-containing protein [Geotalea sp. SG265]|uniref:substrate-binding domain-containing protein n=1 Tax=Geotalea sp. SG265 TaxID=2922867 RepID=UPI001FAFB000|nr:substrate-binding domain-containing protein [Geotalea sp. SG265]
MASTVKNITSLSLVIIGLLFLPALCQARAELIRINGSGAAVDILRPMISAYAKQHPNVKFVVNKPLGSKGAVKALLAGFLDIAVSSKVVTREEAAQGASFSDYGRIPLAVVSPAAVGKQDITTRELTDIFSGKVRQWPNGEPIRIILRPRDDIDAQILAGLSPGMDAALRSARKRPGMIFAATDPEATESILRTPGAIGTAALSCVISAKGRLKAFRLNGRAPTPVGIADGTYPLAKDVRFVTTSRTTAAARDFLRFVYSAQGRAMAKKEGVLVTAMDEKNP